MAILHYDPGAQVIHAESWQDVEPVLEANKEWQGERQTGDFRLHARIPLIAFSQWIYDFFAETGRLISMHSPEMEEIVRKKLADPDNRYMLIKQPERYVHGSGDIR